MYQSVTLGQSLKEARKGKGKTLDDVATAIRTTANQIWEMEQDRGGMDAFDRASTYLSMDWTTLPDANTLGGRVKAARLAKQLTQIEVATRTGLSMASVRRVEANRAYLATLSKVLAVVAPAMRPSKPRVMHKRKSRDTRFTPPKFLEQVRHVLGRDIELDPSSSKGNDHVRARMNYGIGDDGLRRPWDASVIFVNPPYSKADHFLRKAHETYKADRTKLILLLVPVRSQTKTWRSCHVDADILLLTGRLTFWNEHGPMLYGAPFNSAVIIFAARADVLERATQTWDGILIRHPAI